ncbi:hypothetical protein EIN_290220 [Entamoeba invadens IP1]|uniref:Uncharacterized protein n=1 Tax=Entamoeba invadens IP1 TaxID=370355 RepID=L7FKF0_ENTIV|nr:hypothetical protein EIN_290220 [Entamoeba invadens IP1]ELP86614.1 hypothetical protein EIN_290220 [Entamoeba invadens IP1]|eukprot:XP_004185960.1 hypothetical protein EIN_290220 [Entamoeba invadens IP1]
MVFKECKVFLVGDSKVGKTQIKLRFCQGIFVENYNPTMEDQMRKQVEVEGVQFLVVILDDHSSTTEFTAMSDQYYKNADGFIVVFSLDKEESFENLYKYKEEILRHKDKDTFGDIPVVLCANKSDLKFERKVDSYKCEKLSTEWGVPYLEISAKTNINIENAFKDVLKQVINKVGVNLSSKRSQCVTI